MDTLSFTLVKSVMTSPFSFSSKADTLRALSTHEELHIPSPFFAVTKEQWNTSLEDVIHRFRAVFPAGSGVAVRSSCRGEDSEESSAAGAYLSILNVAVDEPETLCDAVNRVFASHGEALPDDQVLVQCMVRTPAVTGVIMTRVLSDGAPYYVINYDDESGRTDTITGGCSASKTVYIYREVRDEDFDSPRLRRFVHLARQLEELCGSDALDIEFCLDGEDVLHLLQVRPMCTQRHWPERHGELTEFIRHGAEFIASRTGSQAGLFGQTSILGVMPDWNPAEMIGILPHPPGKFPVQESHHGTGMERCAGAHGVQDAVGHGTYGHAAGAALYRCACQLQLLPAGRSCPGRG